MIIPKFWASAQLRHRTKGKQATIQRWGWSDISVEEAQIHADARLQEAFTSLVSNWPKISILKREPKVPYNGAEGVPIREEVIVKKGLDIITRNRYGALCLNSPDVMFVDIDAEGVSSPPLTQRKMRGIVAILLALVWWIYWLSLGGSHLDPQRCGCDPGLAEYASVGLSAFGGLVWRLAAMWLAAYLVHLGLWRLYVKTQGGLLGLVRKALTKRGEGECWSIYETPAGLRLLALHKTFDPQSEEVRDLMISLWVDPLYAKMCERQGCFRARVSPKPWRIEMERMRGPVWPVEGEALVRRVQWVEQYQARKVDFASCALIETLGDQRNINPRAQQVKDWHDNLCEALSGKPLA